MTLKTEHSFDVLGTQVAVKPSGFLTPVVVGWLAAIVQSRRANPDAPYRRLWLAPVYLLAWLVADVVHILGHIISSLMANTPLDRLSFAAPFPQSVYENEEVSPWQHRMRAIGGPAANLLVALVHWPLIALTAPGSILRQILEVKRFFHFGLGLVSLIPLPMIDGGSLLKWTLVTRGRSPVEADEAVGQVNAVLGATALTFGLASALARRWLWAAGLISHGAFLLAVGLGRRK